MDPKTKLCSYMVPIYFSQIFIFNHFIVLSPPTVPFQNQRPLYQHPQTSQHHLCNSILHKVFFSLRFPKISQAVNFVCRNMLLQTFFSQVFTFDINITTTYIIFNTCLKCFPSQYFKIRHITSFRVCIHLAPSCDERQSNPPSSALTPYSLRSALKKIPSLAFNMLFQETFSVPTFKTRAELGIKTRMDIWPFLQFFSYSYTSLKTWNASVRSPDSYCLYNKSTAFFNPSHFFRTLQQDKTAPAI